VIYLRREMSLNFVSEEVLEEKRKQRQEEWEKVRTAEEPEEAPEEEVDNRSLYHRLEEQKMKKEADKAEEHKLRNMVQGLKKDETEFLDFVATRQMEHDREKQMEEEKLLQEMEDRRGKLDDLDEAGATSSSSGATLKPAPKSRILGASKRTNQNALLAGVVKKKAKTSTASTSEEPAEKNRLTTTTITTTTGNPAAVVGPTTADNDDADDDDDDDDSKDKEGTGFARVIGVLPGIGEYTDSSESDSENEEETISTKHLGFMKQKKKQAKKSNGE